MPSENTTTKVDGAIKQISVNIRRERGIETDRERERGRQREKERERPTGRDREFVCVCVNMCEKK